VEERKININFVFLWQNKKETTMKNNIETKTQALAMFFFKLIF
jgi:hypothetical protein